MSVVVGYIHKDTVYMGADKQVSGCNSKEFYTDSSSKVFKKGNLLFGLVGSPRTRQLLQHSLDIPARTSGQSLEAYIVTSLADAIRHTLRSASVLETKSGVEAIDSTIMVGTEGRLFCLYSDLCAIETNLSYAAIGSGGDHALGALCAIDKTKKTPRDKIKLAIEAATEQTLYVGGDIEIITRKG